MTMQPNPKFRHQNKQFWAHVRTIGQQLGYTLNQQVRIYLLEQIRLAMNQAGLGTHHLFDASGQPTALAVLLEEYFGYRADTLNTYVEPRLMNVDQAKALFEEYFSKLYPTSPIPMNTQKGDKKQPAYLTALVNMMIDAYTTWWKMGKPYLCRLMDALNMGYVDEILFGYEVVERLPDLVKAWVVIYDSRNRP